MVGLKEVFTTLFVAFLLPSFCGGHILPSTPRGKQPERFLEVRIWFGVGDAQDKGPQRGSYLGVLEPKQPGFR